MAKVAYPPFTVLPKVGFHRLLKGLGLHLGELAGPAAPLEGILERGLAGRLCRDDRVSSNQDAFGLTANIFLEVSSL